MEICLFEPEIAQNAGTLARLCACFGLALNIIEPASFVLSDRNFQRAGMDYIERTVIRCHSDFNSFRQNYKGRMVLLDTKADIPYSSFSFNRADCLLAGRESSGVPDDVYRSCDEAVFIPMKPGCRSLNVAVSVAMVVGEALRQNNWLGLVE